MKQIVFVLVLLSAALLALGATRLLTTQMTGSPTPTGTIVVAQPNGQLAQYGVSGLTLDNTTGTLRVNPVQPSANITVTKSVLTAQTATFNVPSPCKVLLVHWNGLLLSTPEDYAISAGTTAGTSILTFGGAIPQSGDIVQQVCFQ